MEGLRSRKFALLVFAALVVVAAALFGATEAHANPPSVGCTPANPGPTGTITLTASDTSNADYLWITASSGSYTFVLDGGAICSSFHDDHTSGFPSIVVNGSTLPTTFFQEGDTDLSFTGESGVANTLDLTGLTAPATVSVIAGTATWATNNMTFANVTNFNGSFQGTDFVAGGAGGYTFTGNSSGTRLDLSAAGSGISISAASGTVSGLASGGDDNFSGVGSFVGSSSGGTTLVAGSSSLSFTGQSTGNALDFSQVATSPAFPMCINASAVFISGPCGTVFGNNAVAGLSTYTFSGVKTFTGSGNGFTSFFAGSTGGYSFTGGGSGNVLDLGAANSGVSVSVPAGTVGGLTTGGDDSFSGISTFDGPFAGNATLTAGSAGGEAFTGRGSGNTFVAGSGTATFTGGGSNDTLDFSPVVTSSGSPLHVNLSGGDVGALADDQAGFSTPIYSFSGIRNFEGASSGYTDFLGGSTVFNLQGQASGNTLDFSHASGSTLTVNESGGTVNSQATDTAQLGALTDGVTGIKSFVGLSFGSSTFRAPGTGGYSFTGEGANNSLDLSAAGSGISVSVPDGTVTGLSSGGDDTFSGIASFRGSTAGGTTVVAGSSSLSFTGQSTGNALDLSQVATSAATPLCVNVSGAPVCGSGGSSAVVGGTTAYSFDHVSSFTGSADGFTSFVAGSAGGFSFTGAGSGNSLNLAPATAGVSVSVPAGTVGGLTGGDDDFTGSFAQFVGSAAGGNSFLAGSSGGQMFTAAGNGNVFTGGSGSGDTFSGSGNGNTFVAGSGTASFSDGGSNNSLDFSPVVTSAGSPLRVNLSGGVVGALADGQAGFSTPLYTFSGITNFKGASSGYTDFLGGSSAFNLQGQASGNTLDFSHASGSTLTVNESGGTVNSQATDTAQLGAITDGSKGITNFVGLSFGNTAFLAGGTGGYSFTGQGSGDSLDLSAAGSGVTVSVPAGTVSGLTSGGDDTFSGITSFRGSSAGGTTVVAGPGSLTFLGQGTGNALDLSQTVTSAVVPLCVNVSGGPAVMASCGTVANDTASVGFLPAYVFADVSSFTGSADGFTTFAAGGTGGFSFAGGGVGNTLDLSAAPAGTTVMANGDSSGSPGSVTGLTTGTDSFSGIQHIAGPATITPATVTSVSSTLANGTYGIGKHVPVTVTFSEPVNVTGTPQLALNSGGTASYASGSGTDTLTFDYTVADGDSANPLDEASTGALTLNGGTILDALSTAATLTLPAPGADGSLGANKTIEIDTSPMLSITKTADAAVVSTGTSIGFTVTASNGAAGGTALGATLSDPLPGGTGVSWSIAPAYSGAGTCSIQGSVPNQTLGCSFGDLAPGASDSVHVMSATGAGSAGTYANTATLSALNVAGPLQASATVTVRAPALSITKTADAATVSTGSTIGFTVTASNSSAAGTGTATGVSLNDPLPGGTGVSWSVSPAYSGPGACSITGSAPSQALTCAFGTLAPGASAAVHVSSATGAGSAGSYPNTATLSASNAGTPVQASATVTVLAPALSITKTADAATVSTGSTIGFTVTASNSSAGGTGTATGVSLSDPLPGGTGVSWSIAPTYGGTGACIITGSAPTQTLSCSFGDLAPGAGDSVHVSSATGAGSAGMYANTATLTATNAGNPVRASATVTVLAPALTITKTADSSIVATGSSIGFTVAVSNGAAAGTGTATGVSLNDPLPAGTGVSWSISPAYSGPGSCSIQGSVPDQTLECSFGSLAPGAGTSVHVSSATGATSAGSYANTATLSATNAASPVQASATVTVVSPANVTSVSSTAADGTYGVAAHIPVTVTFDEPVTVTGTPRLTINSGGIATYASGNGTSALTFTYVVAAGENANPLDEASTTALSLNGGTIQAPATIDADLTLPAPGTAGSLGANKDLIVDTTPPTITFSTAANKDAGTGWYNKASSGTSGIVVSVSATDPAGISSLSCSDGATAVLSTSSSSGSFTLHDGDHNISCSAIDTVGNSGATPASTGYHAGTANAEFKVDQTAPTITSAIGAPKYGSSPVYVTTATSLTFTVGDSTSGLNSCSITVTDPSSATHSPSCGNGANVYKLDSTLIGGAPVDGSYKNVADATDVAGNAASESSFSVTLDDTAPAITITTPPSGDSANPTVYTYGSVPTASYHCDDGSGSGVASSSGCVGKADGTTVNSGSPLTGTVGLHTLTVTSKDNLGNTTSATHYYDVQAPTSILYTGDESVTYPAAVKLSATLSSPASTCVGNKTVTFTITDASNNTTVKTGTTSPSGAAGPISVSLPEGVYTVEVSYGGTANECLPSQDEATIVVGSAGSKATGGGWTTVNGVGRVNFAFVVDQVPGTGTSPANPPQYKGQYVVVKPNGWRFKGMFGNAVGGTYVVTTTKTGKSGSGTGTGTVYVWSPASATFVPATNGASVSFSIGFADNGSAGKKQTTPDQFANHVNYDPVANGYDTTLNPFPNFTLQAIKGGNITIS